MKTHLFVALIVGLFPFMVSADDDADRASVDTESLWVTSITPAGDGTFVVGSATGLLLRPGAVSRMSPGNVNELTKLYEHPAAVWSVAATSDAKTIASADYRGNLVVYDVAGETPATHETVFERWCQSIAVSPDDKFVLAGNEAGKLFAWNLADSKVEKSIELGEASITCLAFSPDHMQLAASDGTGKVHLLKWPELETIGTITVGEETAWCVAYTGDSESLLVGSADRNLYRVAAEPEAKPESIASGSDWITRIAVSSSGEVAASEVSGKIHFASGGSVTTIGAESGVWALCFGSPGQLLVGTRKNGIVTAGQTWTFQTNTPVAATTSDDSKGDEADVESESESDDAGEAE